jgi:nucleoside-diphosphate-sugar epimerase
MVRILILGATGYIGFPLAQSLRRDAHTVYGLARSAEKAKELAKHEIIPVRGTIEGGEYLQCIHDDNIDVVVDAAGAGPDSAKILQGLKELSAARIRTRGAFGPKIGFVYVGGTWVHGSSHKRVSDLDPVGLDDDAGCPSPPAQLVAWRPVLERDIIAAKDLLDSVVIRPALLYGGPGSNDKCWSTFFRPILSGASSSSPKVRVPADAGARLGLVHVDDVVSALHAAVVKLPYMSTAAGVYPVFDIVGSSEPLKPILDEAAAVLGFHGELIYDGAGDDVFAQAMNTSLKGDSWRLRDLLGWSAKHRSMGEDVELYANSWKLVA